MTLILMEGFDYYEQGQTGVTLENALKRRYSGADMQWGVRSGNIVDGQGGNGNALSFGYVLYFDIPIASATELYWGYSYASNSDYDYYAQPFWTLYNSSSQVITHCYPDYEKAIRISPGGWNVEPFFGPWKPRTARAVDNNWHYLEFYLKPGTTDGAFEVRCNGVTIDSDINIDTQNLGGPITTLRIYGSAYWPNTSVALCDNLYVSDSQFYGPSIVRALRPDADGDDEDWSTSDLGTDSYQLINDQSPADDDTEYLYSSTSTDRTLCNYPSVPSGQTNIEGIQITTQARTDGSSDDMKASVKSGGTVYDQSVVTVDNTTYTERQDILENDPDTASAWTEAGLNAMQVGVEVD